VPEKIEIKRMVSDDEFRIGGRDDEGGGGGGGGGGERRGDFEREPVAVEDGARE
jgi:hypothetical protein